VLDGMFRRLLRLVLRDEVPIRESETRRDQSDSRDPGPNQADSTKPSTESKRKPVSLPSHITARVALTHQRDPEAASVHLVARSSSKYTARESTVSLPEERGGVRGGNKPLDPGQPFLRLARGVFGFEEPSC